MPNPSRETKFSGANADREIFIFPVQLTTSRIGNVVVKSLSVIWILKPKLLICVRSCANL